MHAIFYLDLQQKANLMINIEFMLSMKKTRIFKVVNRETLSANELDTDY
jgi:hypothetical protein